MTTGSKHNSSKQPTKQPNKNKTGKQTDLEIVRSVEPKTIVEVAKKIGLTGSALEPYGHYMAKLSPQCMESCLNKTKRGKLVLVTATSPTRAGEGKTTISIGLTQALNQLNINATASLREPSLGPVFGMKGGATGGGLSQLVPMEDINLHFTGDMHAISAANNLISAVVDNHIHQGNQLKIDTRSIFIKRVLDMNDRALRNIVIGLGGRTNGYPRESGFDITAASEVMAILCLSESIVDLRSRLGNIVVGQNTDRAPVRVQDLKIEDALLALLSKAILPNLVQTLEGTPVLVHGGPFANIAHGCSSILATRAARALSDVVITEAGFGSDLGFEKFCDIVAGQRLDTMSPDAVVLVTTIRALKLHGSIKYSELAKENVEALIKGAANLRRHVSIVSQTGLPFVIAINRFATDTDNEVNALLEHCKALGWKAAVADPYDGGGAGVTELAASVMKALDQSSQFQPFYLRDDTIELKLEKLVKTVYGGAGVEFEPRARKQLKWLRENGYGQSLICVAKTQYSFSDDPTLIGAPQDFILKVEELHLSAGAGFVVAMAGEITRMPGLTKHPSALDFRVDDQGLITHLF